MPVSMGIRQLSSVQSYMVCFLACRSVPDDKCDYWYIYIVYLYVKFWGEQQVLFRVVIFSLTSTRNIAKFFSKRNFGIEMFFGCLTIMFRLDLHEGRFLLCSL